MGHRSRSKYVVDGQGTSVVEKSRHGGKGSHSPAVGNEPRTAGSGTLAVPGDRSGERRFGRPVVMPSVCGADGLCPQVASDWVCSCAPNPDGVAVERTGARSWRGYPMPVSGVLAL